MSLTHEVILLWCFSSPFLVIQWLHDNYAFILFLVLVFNQVFLSSHLSSRKLHLCCFHWWLCSSDYWLVQLPHFSSHAQYRGIPGRESSLSHFWVNLRTVVSGMYKSTVYISFVHISGFIFLKPRLCPRCPCYGDYNGACSEGIEEASSSLQRD